MAKIMRDDKAYGKNGTVDGRYYHFVALQSFPSNWMQRYWESIGQTELQKRGPSIPRSSDFKLVTRKMRSSKSYARGKIIETISAKGNGQPPYYYDLFVMTVIAKGTPYILCGFPFASLALDVAVGALGRAAKSNLGEFCAVDIPRVVKVLEQSENQSSLGGFATRIVTVQVSVRDDKSLAAVRIGGENPLQADLYRSYFQQRVRKGHLVPDYCVLACENHEPEIETGTRSRSRLHIDRFGNLKFYVHSGFRNLALIGNAIEWLADKGCLRRAEANPVLRIDQMNQLDE